MSLVLASRARCHFENEAESRVLYKDLWKNELMLINSYSLLISIVHCT